MAATLTALSVCPAFAMAMWPGQRSRTSIGAVAAGSYRGRPSSPAGHTCHVLADLLHRRDADVRPRLFRSRVSAVRSSAVCRGRLARSARPMRAGRPATRTRAPPRRPLRRCRFHLVAPSADYHRPPTADILVIRLDKSCPGHNSCGLRSGSHRPVRTGSDSHLVMITRCVAQRSKAGAVNRDEPGTRERRLGLSG